jgi:hypothetical protein
LPPGVSASEYTAPRHSVNGQSDRITFELDHRAIYKMSGPSPERTEIVFNDAERRLILSARDVGSANAPTLQLLRQRQGDMSAENLDRGPNRWHRTKRDPWRYALICAENAELAPAAIFLVSPFNN